MPSRPVKNHTGLNNKSQEKSDNLSFLCHCHGFEDYGTQGTTRVVANHALLFMVRGLKKKWKQPIAYYFTCDTVPTDILTNIIKEVVGAAQSVGLIPIASICDQGPTNRGAISELVTRTYDEDSTLAPTFNTTEPIFKVNNQPLYIIYDPPHIIKCLRNLFMNHDIVWWDKNQKLHKRATWSHFELFYKLDQQTARMAYKLTDFHVKPEGHLKMRVNLAAQTFSHTVGAGMMTLATYSDGIVFPKDAMHTAELFEDIDMIFDSLNGSTIYPDRGKLLRCVLSEKSKHLEFS